MWIYKNGVVKSIDDLPTGTHGFVYKILNINTNMYYIGKKSLFSSTWKPIAESTYNKAKASDPQFNLSYKRTRNKKKRKTDPTWIYKKNYVKETNWLTYTGSCKELNNHIKLGNEIEKMIIDIAYSTRQLTYLEAKHLFKNDVLESDNFYNTNILGKFY